MVDPTPNDAPHSATPPETAPEAAPEALSLEEQLAAALNEIAELKDQRLRAVAEQDNIRKRNAQEVQNARDYAIKDFAFSLLAVKDTLEMALKDEHGSAEQIKAGVDMTLRNLVAAFERVKIKEVAAERARFDPNVHQAMSQIESAEVEPGHVLQVFQKGYTIGERVLRPAMVAVSKAPEAPGGDEKNAPPPVEAQP